MAYELRGHQSDIIDQIDAEITFGGKKIMVDACPAYGKSLVMSEVANKYQNEGVIILINITALLDQISEHLTEQGVDHSILKAGREGFDKTKKVQLVMSQTLHARIKKGKVDFDHNFKIYQQDEGHRENREVSARTRECIGYINPEVEILYSGTPYDQLGFKFKGYEYLSNVHAKDLEKQGFLCPIRYFVPKWSEQIDYTKIKKSGIDYSTKDLDKIISSEAHLLLAADSMDKMDAKNKKTMVFCSGIEQAETLTKILKERGYKAEAFHSKTEMSERKIKAFIENKTWDEGPEVRTESIFGEEEWEQHEIKCLISINRLGIGFDCPDVKLAVQLRPTKIRSLYIQQVMRVARKHPSKTFSEYLDLGQTLKNFGFHTDLYRPPAKSSDKDENKQALENASTEKLEDLVAVLSNELSEITIEKYSKKIEEIKENSKRKLTDLSAEELSAVYDLSNDHKEIISIACIIHTYKYGRPVSKKGYEYDYRPENFWSASTFGDNPEFHVPHDMDWYFEQAPEKKRQWNRALKTRARRLIQKGDKLFKLTGFIKFLYEEWQNEQYSYTKNFDERQDGELMRNLSVGDDRMPDYGIDIEEDEIPF